MVRSKPKAGRINPSGLFNHSVASSSTPLRNEKEVVIVEDDEADDLASIFPIQFAHALDPSSTSTTSPIDTLRKVELKQMEFEDCTSRINLDLLLKCAREACGITNHLNGLLMVNGSNEEQIPEISHKMENGVKRRRESSDIEIGPIKRAKKVDTDVLLISTACQFEVLMRNTQEKQMAHQLKNLLYRYGGDERLSNVCTINRISIIPAMTQDPEALITKHLQLYDKEERIIVHLPLIDNERLKDDRVMHRYSNSGWFESLYALSGGQATHTNEKRYPIRFEADFDIVRESSDGFFSSFSEAFTIELRIRVFLRSNVLQTSWYADSAATAEQCHRLMRFAFPNDEDEDLIRKHSQVDSSIVYNALQPSSLQAHTPLELMQPRFLNANLLPFQRKSVHFLLGREGKKVLNKSEDGSVSLGLLPGIMTPKGVQGLGLFWKKLSPTLYHNPFSGSLTSDIVATRAFETQGGILAEEMGLGKTVEIFALTLLNHDEDRSSQLSYFDHSQEVEVWPTKTTLIVAPEVLRQQWLDEAALHAPELRAFSYIGYKEASTEIPEGSSWHEHARKFDLMVVSFDTLRKELLVARKAPQRSRRFERKYERPRSLLIQLAFHRVVMDEVQLVGHASAAETVSMISRNHSIAVSGTPLKQMSDIQSLFKFLRVPGPIHSNPFWQRLLQPNMIPTLQSAMRMLAIRHTKSQVRQEISLPQQTRILVPVHFTAVELTFYRDIYQRLLSAINIDPSGYATRRQLLNHVHSTFGDDIGQLRSTLLALRQACTHPQIAGSGIRGTALAASQTIRSMDEVLTIMIEGSRSEFDSIGHSIVQKRIDRAVLLLQRKDDDTRHDIAKAMLLSVQEEVETRIKGVKENLEKARRVGPLYKFTKKELAEGGRLSPEFDDQILEEEKKRGMNTEVNGAKSQIEQEKDAKSVQRRRHMTALQQRLRVYLEQLHRCLHFLGNIHFQMGDKLKGGISNTGGNITGESKDTQPNLTDAQSAIFTEPKVNGESSDALLILSLKKQEDEWYDKAEETRQTLLKERRKAVEQSLVSCHRAAIDTLIEEVYGREQFGEGGIRSRNQFDMLKKLQEKLNAQTDLIFQWRQDILKRLEKPVNRVVSAEDENDDQYQENLDAQAEAEAILEMYRVLISEREFMLTNVKIEGTLGRPQLFVQLEREVPQLEKALRRQMLQEASNSEFRTEMFLNDPLPSDQEIGVLRQQLDHLHRLETEKNCVSISRESKPSKNRSRAQRIQDRTAEHSNEEDVIFEGEGFDEIQSLLPFESILRELREIVQSIDAREEIMIIRFGIDKVRQLVGKQKTILEKLKRESSTFSAVWNARAAYFKQIQDLSDQVADIELIGSMREQEKMNNLEREEASLKRRQEICAGRLRYLNAIEEEEGDEEKDDELDSKGDDQIANKDTDNSRKICPICTEIMTKAVVLETCGHVVCVTCHLRWTAQKGQCPMCKTQVNLRNVYYVTYGAKGKRSQVELPGSEKRLKQSKRYNIIDDSTLLAIRQMPIRSSLGSKLDLLTRHLLYIESSQRGTKSLIFTAFSRGITLVGDALRLNGIKFVTLEQGGARGGRIIDLFKNDSDINVLLLHSEAQSSGLNLVCAQNIFLLEPLVNHALELQAIGRVHRIGQTKQTTVFCYQVNDTVEERIVDLASKRNQSLFIKENCIANDLKDSAEMVAKVQEGKVRKRGSTNNATSKKEGEYVEQISEVVSCLFGEEDGQSSSINNNTSNDNAASSSNSTQTVISQTSSTSNRKTEQEELEQMRLDRLRAIEKRYQNQNDNN